MAALDVQLFGTFSVRRDDRELAHFGGAKMQELFSYLLLHTDRRHHRESLAATLWADTPTAQARKNLRQTLWQLQTTLAETVAPDRPAVVAVESDWVFVDTQADLTTDVELFERAASSVQGVPGRDLDAAAAARLRDAVGLYRGDLLADWYQDWCIYRREWLQQRFLAMIDKLMAYCEVHAEYESAIDFGERVLLYDRARETTHYKLMRLRALAGDRTGSLRQFERCVAALHAELAVRPARATVALHEQIRDDRPLTGTSTAHDVDQSVPETPPPHADVSRYLQQLGLFLLDLQRQVQHDLQASHLGSHHRN
ncbi:MAG TPA: BTAD domain-containing putative transcriptional regulator [Thermomicrobiales bacterium]|jgi:DNA-binding SARP family transcriptional activator